jgi:hypothetical protein
MSSLVTFSFFLLKKVVLQPFFIDKFYQKRKIKHEKVKSGVIFEISIIIFLYMVIINRKTIKYYYKKYIHMYFITKFGNIILKSIIPFRKSQNS